MKNIIKIILTILLSVFYFSHANAVIKDGLFATVGNKAITHSDIMDEVKTILILNAQKFSEDKRAQIERAAIRSTIKRFIKEIEIEKYQILTFNQKELEKRLMEISKRINVSVDDLEKICEANGLSLEHIKHQIKIELLWNTLIYEIYKDRLTFNQKEIEEQLSLMESSLYEYLLSEIIIELDPNDNLEKKIINLKKDIENQSFEKVAMNSSISETAINGGDLGWINEKSISKKFKDEIVKTQVGNISEPILIQQGIIIFKMRDKRKLEISENYDEKKRQLINIEKNKILNMHSTSHYENLRRNITINYY